LNFHPYNTNEIIGILKDRFSHVKGITVQDNALELCSRKVAAMGDIRKAFDFIT
jgi:Cdc6-like AAA superfamily ATPase